MCNREKKMKKDNPPERNGEAIPESITRHSQSNFLLGSGFPAARGARHGGTEGITLDDHQAWCGDRACEGGACRHFEIEEVLEVTEGSSDKNLREESKRWIVRCGEVMLTLRNPCTWTYISLNRPGNLDWNAGPTIEDIACAVIEDRYASRGGHDRGGDHW